MTGQVAWIHVAPIKALAIQELHEVDLGPRGVEDDRRFCIVDVEGRMLNAKRVPSFIAVRPELSGGRLRMRMPDATDFEAPVRLGSSTDVTIYGRIVPARLVDGPWTDALSELARQPVRLIRFDEPGEGVDRADEGGSASLLSAASLDAIANAAEAKTPADPRRFRMLFGIAGVPPHAEDAWIGREVVVGEAVLVPCGNIGRCAVTGLDPDRGVPTLDTLKALARYRRDLPTTEPLPFGVWARVARPGRVRVGDRVDAG
jgi:uncharacterized protein